jgi:hypothetical protein
MNNDVAMKNEKHVVIISANPEEFRFRKSFLSIALLLTHAVSFVVGYHVAEPIASNSDDTEYTEGLHTGYELGRSDVTSMILSPPFRLRSSAHGIPSLDRMATCTSAAD